MIPTYAVIPTMWRPCAREAFASLAPQVEHLIVVSTSEPVPGLACSSASVVSAPPSLGRNISAWWNLGLDVAALLSSKSLSPVWNALVVNDDVISPPHLVQTLAAEMRGAGVSMAYPDCFSGDRRVVNRKAGPVDLTTRIAGWCFMLRGEDGWRADERLEWWYGDDDLDWRCREARGSMMVPGCRVDHLYPGDLTSRSAELSQQTHRDRETFYKIWEGRAPH